MQDIELFIQNHWLLALGAAVILSLLILLEFIKQKSNGKQLSPAELTQLINHQNAVLIDIRPATLFNEGHIIGSISVPLADLERKLRSLEKFKSQPIVIICMAGNESPPVVIKLTELGFNVQILAGGIRTWRDADLPLVKG